MSFAINRAYTYSPLSFTGKQSYLSQYKLISFAFQALKAIGETEVLHEQAMQAMAKGDLEKSQTLYSKYMTDLDEHLAPPYPDYYKTQQYIWKCIWMRYGNRVIRGKMPQAPTNDFDAVD